MENKNYQFFLNADISDYIGEWIAISNKKIVAHGKNLKEVFKEAKDKCPKEKPLITRVPEKETMIFLLK